MLAGVNREGKIVQRRTPAASQASMIASHRGQRDLQRLLDDHVLAGAGRLDGRIAMGAAGRADADDIQPRVRKHRVQVVIDRAAVPGHPGDLLGVGPGAAERGHHAGAGYLVDRPGVKLGDHPAANEAKTMLGHARFLSMSRVSVQTGSRPAVSWRSCACHAHDQAVRDIDQGLRVGDRLPVRAHVEPALFDHPPGVRGTCLEAQLLDQERSGDRVPRRRACRRRA